MASRYPRILFMSNKYIQQFPISDSSWLIARSQDTIRQSMLRQIVLQSLLNDMLCVCSVKNVKTPKDIQRWWTIWVNLMQPLEQLILPVLFSQSLWLPMLMHPLKYLPQIHSDPSWHANKHTMTWTALESWSTESDLKAKQVKGLWKCLACYKASSPFQSPRRWE